MSREQYYPSPQHMDILDKVGWGSSLHWNYILDGFGVTYKTRSTGVIYTLCGWHREKTPSCVLGPSGVTFCYGCGHRGDVIDYLATKILGINMNNLFPPLSEIEIISLFDRIPSPKYDSQLPLFTF